MKFLLKGSNLVGMEKVSLVCRILNVHGTMREHVKLVHSVVRVELNELEGDEFGVCTVLLPLVAALRGLGECSYARGRNNLESIGSDDLRLSLGGIFGRECPTDAYLSSGYYAVLNLTFGKNYDES